MNKKLMETKYVLTNNTKYGIIVHTENKNGKFPENDDSVGARWIAMAGKAE